MKTTNQTCAWCRQPAGTTPGQVYCSRKCRQAAFRLRQRVAQDLSDAEPGRFAYADPPYPGLARKYYKNEPTFAGEVDHRQLIASLEASNYTGWALSTSAAALRDILPMCPPG